MGSPGRLGHPNQRCLGLWEALPVLRQAHWSHFRGLALLILF